MSFAGNVKKELYAAYGSSRHCRIAELAAFCSLLGSCEKKDGHLVFSLETSNPKIQQKFFTLVKKTISINGYDALELRDDDARELLSAIHMLKEDRFVPEPVDGVLLQQPCCRGAFLSAGSVSDPNRSYHFEIACRNEAGARQLADCILSLGFEAKVTRRKDRWPVYLKEGSQIVDLIGMMGASAAFLDFENVRILKDMRNAVNRRVNCETANITKTVSASVRQIEDIRLIEQTSGLSSLPPNLREIALARLDNPEIPLKDLGSRLNPPIGKSGVNHRLRKIAEIADKLKEERS